MPKEKEKRKDEAEVGKSTTKMTLDDILNKAKVGFTKQMREKKEEKKKNSQDLGGEYAKKDPLERKVIQNVDLSRVITFKTSEYAPPSFSFSI